MSIRVTKKFIGCFAGFPSSTDKTVNEKPIDRKYSGYADAFYMRADIDYVWRRFAFTVWSVESHLIEMRYFFFLLFPLTVRSSAFYCADRLFIDLNRFLLRSDVLICLICTSPINTLRNKKFRCTVIIAARMSLKTYIKTQIYLF